MNDWGYAQTDPSQDLAWMHWFSMKKVEADRVIEFNITVREFFEPGVK